MKNYTSLVQSLFHNRAYFIELLDKFSGEKKKQERKNWTLLKRILGGVLTINILNLAGSYWFDYQSNALFVFALCVAFLFISTGLVELRSTFDNARIKGLKAQLLQDLRDNPGLLQDLARLCVDKESSFHFNHLVDAVRDSQVHPGMIEKIYVMLENYTLHQQYKQSDPQRSEFLKLHGIELPHEAQENKEATPKQKMMEMV